MGVSWKRCADTWPQTMAHRACLKACARFASVSMWQPPPATVTAEPWVNMNTRPPIIAHPTPPHAPLHFHASHALATHQFDDCQGDQIVKKKGNMWSLKEFPLMCSLVFRALQSSLQSWGYISSLFVSSSNRGGQMGKNSLYFSWWEVSRLEGADVDILTRRAIIWFQRQQKGKSLSKRWPQDPVWHIKKFTELQRIKTWELQMLHLVLRNDRWRSPFFWGCQKRSTTVCDEFRLNMAMLETHFSCRDKKCKWWFITRNLFLINQLIKIHLCSFKNFIHECLSLVGANLSVKYHKEKTLGITICPYTAKKKLHTTPPFLSTQFALFRCSGANFTLSWHKLVTGTIQVNCDVIWLTLGAIAKLSPNWIQSRPEYFFLLF